MPPIEPLPDREDLFQRLKRLSFLQRVDWHAELDSTNTAASLLSGQRTCPLPMLIGADRQTAGRGRGQNTWWSADGALTFSLLLNPLDHGVPFAKWPQLALMTGLAVADVLEQHLPPTAVQLKWPNDVYLSGKKICGILTEVPAGCSDRLVVGIGINVGNSLRDAPVEIAGTATSLFDHLGELAPPRETVLCEVITAWERWLKRLGAGEIDFPALWRTKCYLTGAQVSVTVGTETVIGQCQGLDADGLLLLETDRGSQRILAGTVRRLSP